MSDRAYEILGLATIYFALGTFVFMFLIVVAFEWMDDKLQRIKRLFKKKKRPAQARNRAVVRRTAKRTTPTRTVRRRTA